MGKQSFQIRYIYNPLPDQYFQDPLVDNYCSKVTFNGRSYLLELHGISRQVGELHVLFKLFMQNAQFKRRIVIKEIKRKEFCIIFFSLYFFVSVNISLLGKVQTITPPELSKHRCLHSLLFYREQELV